MTTETAKFFSLVLDSKDCEVFYMVSVTTAPPQPLV